MLAGENWILSSGNRDASRKIFIIQGQSESRIWWVGEQSCTSCIASSPWTSRISTVKCWIHLHTFFCRDLAEQSAPCFAVVPTHAYIVHPHAYALYHGASCSAWLLTKMFHLIFWLVLFVQVLSLQHHILHCCININYLNRSKGINSIKGKAIKI